MKRRNFLVLTTAAATASSWPLKALSGLGESSPIYRFIQLNDTHMSGTLDSKGPYAGANSRLRWFINHLNEETGNVPSFLLFLGDMMHGGNLESLAPEMAELKKNVIQKLPCEVYPCIGNHEDNQRQGDPAYNQPYLNAFGSDRVDYMFERGPLQFVVFDNSGMPPRASIKMEAEHEALRVKRLGWLRGLLEASPEKKKVICCHIPLACVRQKAVLEKSFGFPSYYAHDEELLSLLSEYKKSIVAVLSGHLHLTARAEVDGIQHIVTSGLASYPHDYAVYDVYRDRVDVRMASVPENLQAPYASNIHNSRRHGLDYTDDLHPTHEQYVKGNADERIFSLAL